MAIMNSIHVAHAGRPDFILASMLLNRLIIMTLTYRESSHRNSRNKTKGLATHS